MLKFFGLMTVKAHKAALAKEEETHKLNAASISYLVDENERLDLAFRRQSAMIDWFEANAAIRDPRTGRMMTKDAGEEAMRVHWLSL